MKLIGVQVIETTWSYVNRGMAINRSVWNLLYGCKESFCTFDDYNWDKTLLHLRQVCLPDDLRVYVPSVPRLYHVGKCGFHYHGKDCDTSTLFQQVASINTKIKLFPESLVIKTTDGRSHQPPPNQKGWGGWSDRRDQALCLNMAEPDPLAFIHQLTTYAAT